MYHDGFALQFGISILSCRSEAFRPSGKSAEVKRLHILKLTLGLLAKFSSSLVLSAIFVWTLELIPTLIRARAFSILAVAGRIGGGASPWITQGRLQYGSLVPFVSLGSITLLGGILLCFLPESKNLHIDEEDTFDGIPLLEPSQDDH